MNVIEAMARAMCSSAAIDPDDKTITGVLTTGESDGMVFTILNRDRLEDAQPAWVNFKAAAKVAYEAYSKAVLAVKVDD